MPGLKLGPSNTPVRCSPLGADPPAHTRRIWQHPDLTSHSLLVLTLERLCLVSGDESPPPEVVAALREGADPDRLVGSAGTVIDITAIRRVSLDLETNTLTLDLIGTGVGASRQCVRFATPEAADACFTKLWRRLGEGVVLTPYRRNNWHLARGPLGLLLGALLATALVVIVLNLLADMASARAASGVHAPLEVFVRWLDWRVVCGLGGAVAAVSQVWLYRRLTAPPRNLELVRN